jgi:cation:H+ antiporter
MLYSAETFAGSLAGFAHPFVYAVVISPFGTCLQEVVAAVLLALKGKGDVGMAVLAGENVIQATIVSGVGMLATPWTLPFTGFAVALIFALVGLVYSFAPHTMRYLGIPAYVGYIFLAAILA